MAQIEVLLKTGLVLKDQAGRETAHTAAALREATTGDLLDAAAESERIVVHPETGRAVIAVSPLLESMHVLRRQVVRVGDIQGPLTLTELRKLTPEDLGALQRHAALLDTAALEEARRWGEPDGDRDDDPAD